MRATLSVLTLAALMALPIAAAAQVNTATINGIVSDESKAILPGATVTASDLATGRKYVGVSDERGAYKISVPPGTYQVQAELAGFGNAEVPKVELLRRPERVDRVHVEDLVAGGNADGDRRSAAGRPHLDAGRRQRRPPPDGGDAAAGPQLAGAVDARQGHHGQRRDQHARRQPATTIVQPEPRRPADHAEGAGVRLRPAAVQPRGDRRIPDRHQPVRHHPGPIDRHPGAGDLASRARTACPARSTATSATTSSTRRIRSRDRCCRTRTSRSAARSAGRSSRTSLHYFFTYEHENNPATVFTQPPQLGGPSFTVASPTTARTATWAAATCRSRRATRCRCAGRTGELENPFSLLGPDVSLARAASCRRSRRTRRRPGRASSANNRVGQLLVGYNHFLSSTMPQPGVFGQPQYDFPGATMGAPFNYPSIEGTNTYQFRYNQTWTHDKHEFKFGGEYLKAHDTGTAYYSAFGRMTFLSLPSPAEMARRFPIDRWNNPAAWDLNGLDANRAAIRSQLRSRRRRHPVLELRRAPADLRAVVRRRLAPQSKLTVNYGLRWDDDWGAAAPSGNHRELDPDQQRASRAAISASSRTSTITRTSRRAAASATTSAARTTS